jgi:hypothetical protein
MYLSAHQDDVRTMHFMVTITLTLTSATLVLRGYHLHVVLIGFYSSHNIRAITILPSNYSPISPSVVLLL